jgi:mono/diheme cytochrome c family protein
MLQGIKPPNSVPDKTMPAFASLSDDDVADLVAFIRARFSDQAPSTDIRDHLAQARGGPRH